MKPPPTLADVIRAMAAGSPVDWDAASSTPADDSVSSMLVQLQKIAQISSVHNTTRAGALASEDPEGRLESWGPFTILEPIGQGTYGQVYRAWDPRLDREVALKLLQPALPSDRTELPVFIEEGRLLARVRHPNVVTVYGADRIDGRAGIWMELVNGRTLEQIIHDHGPLSAHEATIVGIEVLRGLSAVHRAGLLHRDIKAQNVMREAGGRVVLMDFGAGQHTADAGVAAVAGTPLYVAPEVLCGGSASVQADLYSVGVLLYRLVANEFPFPGTTVAAVQAAHRSGRPALLRDRRPDLPDRFVALVERAIDLDPGRRPHSAGEFETALRSLDVPGDSAPVRSRRRFGAIAAVAAIAAVLVTAGLTDTSAALGRLVRRFSSSPGGVASAALRNSNASMHKVVFPDAMLVGAPSFDGTGFSYTDLDGDVAIFNVASGETRKVTRKGDTSEFAEFSVMSADGRFVAYMWWTLDNAYEVRVVGVDGRWPRVVLRRDDVPYPLVREWSRDGSRLLLELQKADGTVQIGTVRLSDGALTIATSFGAESPRHVALSPDNRFIAFDFPQASGASERDVFIVPAGGGTPHAVIAHPANDLNPVWSADGSSLLFMSDRTGAMSLWTAPVRDGALESEPVLAMRNLGLAEPIAMTRDGNYYYNSVAGSTDVFTSTIDLTGAHEASPAARVASRFNGLNINSGWSRDGRYLAYISIQGSVFFDRGSRLLTIRDVPSGSERSIVPDIFLGFAPLRWSPDGKAILVRGKNRKNRSGWFIVDVASGKSRPAVLIDSPANETDYGIADWTADGSGVLYEHAGDGVLQRDLATGVERVVVEPPPPSHRVLRFALSPDGRSWAALIPVPSADQSANTLSLQTAVLGGVPREVLRTTGRERITFQGWTPDGQDLLYTRIGMPKSPDTLWVVAARGGEPRPLGLSIEGVTASNPVAIRSDGRTVAFTGGRFHMEVWVLERLLSTNGMALH